MAPVHLSAKPVRVLLNRGNVIFRSCLSFQLIFKIVKGWFSYGLRESGGLLPSSAKKIFYLNNWSSQVITGVTTITGWCCCGCCITAAESSHLLVDCWSYRIIIRCYRVVRAGVLVDIKFFLQIYTLISNKGF